MARKPTKAEAKRQLAYEELFRKFYSTTASWAEARIAQGLAIFDPEAANYMARVVKEREALAADKKRLEDAVAAEKKADKEALRDDHKTV